MVIILVKRCVRRDKVDAFLAKYRGEKPAENPAFFGETLTRVDDSADLPEALRNFRVAGEECMTFINVARWKSAEAFDAAFNPKPGYYDPDIETEPRVRAVLGVVE